MPKARLFVIDAHALCYRAFYAIRNLSARDGQHTNAVYGFINTLKKILKENAPEYMAVCFDSSRKTYRQEKFVEYKIQRPSMPDELKSQIPIIKDIVRAYNIQMFESPGYEADDIIATLAKWPFTEDVEIIIVSEDKDLYQLVNDKVSVMSVRKNKILTAKDVLAILGFEPGLITDYIGLAGDKIDNIPGINGIGEVTAKKLIAQFGSLENIFDGYQEIASKKIQAKILEHKEIAVLSKELAHLECKVPLDITIEALKVRDPDWESLLELYKKLEFHKWAQEVMLEFHEEDSREIKEVKGEQSFQLLIEEIRAKGEFAFFCDEEKKFDGAEVRDRPLYLCLSGETVFRFRLVDIRQLKPVFDDPGILKITYNFKYFLKVLSCLEGPDEDMVLALVKVKDSRNFFDIKLAGYLLSSGEMAFKLNDLAWNYLKKSIPAGSCSANKVIAVYQLYLLMYNQLHARGIVNLFESIEMPLSIVLFKMEKQGVQLDVDFLRELSIACDKKIESLQSRLFAMAGEEFNLNSPKQLSQILFEKMKLPVIKRIKTGYSTNEEVLIKLAVKHEFPAILLEYRQLAKLKSTYIDALPKLVDPVTRRIHAQFLQTGTETGRLSSRNPNLQNIPIRTELGRKIRKAFIPFDEEAVLLKADYSQIELRILAHLSDDETLKKAFSDDQDVHAYTASLIFEKEESEVTRQMRDAAKRVNFGIIYGMSPYGLAKDLKISQAEAKDFIDKYFFRYPKVKTFMDDMIRDCEEKGFVNTILGRRRDIAHIHDTNGALRQFAQRQAINTPVQGSAADLIKLAMINVEKTLEEKAYDAKMIITVHDELVFNVPKGELDEVAAMVRDQMEKAIELSVPVKVTIKSGPNWLDMEEVNFCREKCL